MENSTSPSTVISSPNPPLEASAGLSSSDTMHSPFLWDKATPIGNYVSGPPPACIFEIMII